MGVSIREFGRQVGVSHVTVQKLIKAGALPQNSDGTIPLEKGLKAYRAYKDAPRNKGGRPRKEESPKQRTPIEEVDAEREQRSEQAVNMNAAMNKAKLADTTFKAKIRELEFKFRAGELLDKSDDSKFAIQYGGLHLHRSWCGGNGIIGFDGSQALHGYMRCFWHIGRRWGKFAGGNQVGRKRLPFRQ